MKYFQSIIKPAGLAMAFTCALFISSCKKSTELLPKDALPSSVTFSTAANVELAAIGMYATAHVNTDLSAVFNGDEIIRNELRGEDMVSNGFSPTIYLNNIINTDTRVTSEWTSLYAVINQTNTFIDGVHAALASGILTPAAAASYEGEARFLRALSHHELVVNFARPYLDNAGANPGVPYRVIPVNTPANLDLSLQVDRGTVKQDYTMILADLDYAEANLIDNHAHPISRVSKGAAIALKTRVKLYMGDWAGVISEGAKLGTGGSGNYTSPIGGYQLTASPDGPFVNNGGNTESIFSIENSASSNAQVNNALPALFGYTDGNGRGFYMTSPNLYNASFWVSSDTRRTLLQIRNTGASSSKFVYNNKYQDLTNLTDWTPIIRYAEVLLNVAEADSRTGVPNALNLLNAVRNRAVAPEDQYTSASFPTANSLTQAILNERRIEFAGEGLRWGDIHRLAMDPNFSTGGIPAKVSYTDVKADGSNYDIVNRPVTPSKIPAVTYSDHRFIWPFPQSETTTNPLLAKEQNPGY